MESAQLPLLVSDSSSNAVPRLAESTVRKLDRHVASLTTFGMLLHASSRQILALAANDLCNALGFSNTAYGTGLSLFFCGFVGVMTFSGELLRRFGAPTWFAIIMFCWGALCVSLGFIQNALHYDLLMLAFGFAQGSWYSGVTYYLSLFYPDAYVAGPYAALQAALAFSMPVTSWISIGLFSLDSLISVDGWRLLLYVLGAIPVAFSPFVYFMLPASVDTARFLDTEEKTWLQGALAKQSHQSNALSLYPSLKRIFQMRVFWIGSAVTFLYDSQEKLIFSWVPLIVAAALSDGDRDSETCGVEEGSTVTAIGLTSVPFAVSGIICILVSRFHHAIQRPSRFVSAVQVVSGCCLLSWIALNKISFVAGFVPLTVSISISLCTIAVFTRVFVSNFGHDVVGTALAAFNTIGNAGVLWLPAVLGVLMDAYGHAVFVAVVGAMTLGCGILMNFVSTPQQSILSPRHSTL